MSSGVLPGKSYPLGATVYSDGVNFCVFSKNCYALELLLFDDVDDTKPHVIEFDPEYNKTFYYWHMFVPNLVEGQLYGYRAYGPFEPSKGYRFDGWKVLLDPYTRAVARGRNYDRDAAVLPGDNCAHALKSVVVDTGHYDWEGDVPLNIPLSGTVIYETHVKGFTYHPSSGVTPELRGTYLGLTEKIPYLKDLGITAVELLPVQEFDTHAVTPTMTNYWGYSTIAFFAPHAAYSSCKDVLAPIEEFRDMVKAFHKAGIEVILDVVFNHTAEGNENGPTFSFRGLENRAYYILEQNKSRYANYSGCGNTLNTNHSIVRRMIMDCLRYWASEMHVDGFRFDLASVMARDESGQPLKSPPILWEIESDPVLVGKKIIAEAWDMGLYQVGSFTGDRWSEWNGPFRDDVRRFVKSDDDSVAKLAARITASPDLYLKSGREPNNSINFITCHDGFTLNDLVSYSAKHNEANGEDNHDGSDSNFSWNSGVEGPTENSEIERLRLQQIKNFLTILLVSHGTPMLLMGDEVRRTQFGNNNAYCQDNEINWFDWDTLEQNKGLLRFVQGLIRFTQSRKIFREEDFWFKPDGNGEPHIVWHGVRLGSPDWSYNSHSLAFTLNYSPTGDRLHIMLNAYWEPLSFELPPLPVAGGDCWHRIVDTALVSPNDYRDPEDALPIPRDSYCLQPRSSVVLLALPRRS